ncbi:hypothetical protein [Carboxylicivirga linearis]|uniref:2TM domain-containing protein n=1 Tax=Carboxylicivirga linearis TaxID=1628157 RepID=A0ABS5K3Q3_9BACT|nr:hypothetical protein [Carboxylicivirga linearis]MBS2101154.1 hypothetical protein [Carboxylicivirga linearis]
MLNWKENLNKESKSVLFDLFSETNRINLEPQLYAGNLLFEKKYDIESLIKAKTNLIEAIEKSFTRKYHQDPKKIAKETIIRELFFRFLLTIIIVLTFLQGIEFHYELLNLRIDNRIIAWLLGLINLIPLIWIKTTIRKALSKVKKELTKKDNMIEQINTTLKF